MHAFLEDNPPPRQQYRSDQVQLRLVTELVNMHARLSPSELMHSRVIAYSPLHASQDA